MDIPRPAVCILSALVRVGDSILDRRLASSPHVVGGEIARLVHEYVLRKNLGYYPALEYFQAQDALDADLLNAEESIAWFVTHLVEDEARRYLLPAFSRVDFLAVQPIAYTMPAIRPTMPNALHELTRHFTANTVKLTLRLTAMVQPATVPEIERWTEQRFRAYLEPHFDALEITHCDQLIEQT